MMPKVSDVYYIVDILYKKFDPAEIGQVGTKQFLIQCFSTHFFILPLLDGFSSPLSFTH
jgi:hypothetical protein